MRDNRAGLIPHSIYLIYTIYMIVFALLNKWPSAVVEAIIIGAVVCVLAFMIEGKWSKYKYLIFAAIVWMNVTLYVIYGRSLLSILPAVAAVVVMLSLFDKVKVNYVSVFAYILLIILNVFIHPDDFDTVRDSAFASAQFLSIFIVEWIEIRMLKIRLENNAQLEMSQREQKKAEQGKDDFMANVSHEIRTPLNVICGTNDALLEAKLDEELMRIVKDSYISGQNLRMLVADILDFTELQNDRVEIINEPYNIVSILNDATIMASAWNKEKNLEIIIDCQSTIPKKLIGDGQKIYRILLHILSNAIKFTEKGGVVLTVSAREEAYGVNLSFVIEDTGIGIRPEDMENLSRVYNQLDTKRDRQNTGIGIGLEITKKIISKMNGFFHMDSVAGAGTRVSISIPQKKGSEERLIEVNNPEKITVLYYLDLSKYNSGQIRDAYLNVAGRITDEMGFISFRCNNQAELERRVVTEHPTHIVTAYEEYNAAREYFNKIAHEFTVILVLDMNDNTEGIDKKIKLMYKPFQVFSLTTILNGAEADEVKWTAKEKFEAKTSRVMVVDDSPMNLKVVEFMLKKYGIEVYKAGSGREAIREIQSNQYDLVFMDHMMPEMDGVECLHHIRSLPGGYNKTVPIVALTANAVGGAHEMMIHEGFDDFIAKPIEKNNFERILRKYLEIKIEEA